MPNTTASARLLRQALVGVECSFCHVPGKMDADESRPRRPRRMMLMTNEINKAHFGGRQQMTLLLVPQRCQRIRLRARALIRHGAEITRSLQPPRAPLPHGGSDYRQIRCGTWRRRRDAQGHQPANERQDTGSRYGNANRRSYEGAQQARDHQPWQSRQLHSLDGAAGWMGNTGRPARSMSDAESGASALERGVLSRPSAPGTVSAVAPRPSGKPCGRRL